VSTAPFATRESTPAGGSTRNAAPDLTSHQLHVAETWLQRGHAVIPCNRKDKAPLVPGFGRDATAEDLAPFSDPQQVHAWWTGRFRRAHVGILTRRLVVIDLDSPAPDAPPLTGRWAGCVHGADVLEVHMREAGATWPETYTVETPGKGKLLPGVHLYYEMPKDEPIGCATGEGPAAPHIGPLVDVRGVGGLVIAAGSYSSVQGRPYRRVSPPEMRPQPLPEWLLALLRPADLPTQRRTPLPAVVLSAGSSRAERYAAKALAGQVEAVRVAGEGDRWRTLTAATFRLAELHATAPAVLSEQVVREQLLAASGLPEREAEKAFRGAWAKGAAGSHLGGAA
jgi:hypothetical protein